MDGNEKNSGVSNAQIMYSIGELTGSVKSMHQGVTSQIEDIRKDLRRMEQSTNERMNRLEDSQNEKIEAMGHTIETRIGTLDKTLGDRITSLNTRVTNLETGEKDTIRKVAGISAISGILVTTAVYFVSHIK